MHPEVRASRPGACPKCGMALEPEGGESETAHHHGGHDELADFSRRFWIGAALTLPLVVIEMMATGPLIPWIEFALATPVVLWAGAPFFQRFWTSLVNRHLNMFTLIALGTGAAWTSSTAFLLAPDFVPAAFRGEGGAVPLYFEPAAVITVLVLLGQILELRARRKTSGAIKALLDLAPKNAVRVHDDGTDETVHICRIHVGDRLRVRPGEKIPVDGEVVTGSAAVDESLVTGEPLPVTKEPGAAVIAGALNKTGSFTMRATRVGKETLLAQIVEMVAKAQRSRAPIQRVADSVSAWFVSAVVLVAVAAFAAWALFGPEPRLTYALVAAVSVLIIACPCALGLATPISIIVGVGRGAQAGVLIKNAEALEIFEKIDTIVIDKTGTLTEGKPAVVALRAAMGFSEEDVLRFAASLERASEHPLAEAIVRAALERKIALPEPTQFDAAPGKGVVGRVEGRIVVVGSSMFLVQNGVDTAPFGGEAAALGAEGATAIFAAIDGRLAGLLGIADRIKQTTPAALDALRAENSRIVMLTGDNRATAKAIGAKLGLAEIEAGILPGDKARIVERLRKEGRVVAMAGDGINDAPALAAADVGIAMGAGADVAIESAGMTLLTGDLAALVKARRLSRATMRNIRQNLFFAFAYNAAGVPLAAGALYPLFGLTLSPEFAAAAMAASSLSVVANALRLRAIKL